MSEFAGVSLACLFAVSALVLGTAATATALDRSEGDFWTYEVSMDIEGVDVGGEVTVTFEGYDTVTVNGTQFDVCFLAMTGHFSGSVSVLGTPMTVSGAMIGTSYETRDAYGTVIEDMTTYINVTWGEDPFQILRNGKVEVTTTCSPPRGAGFNPTDAVLGDSWQETVTEVTTSYVDEELDEDESGTEVRTYSFAIAPSRESVTVPAGTFDTLKVTKTDDDGTRQVLWFSEDVGDAVRIEYFNETDDPYASYELSGYAHEAEGMPIVLLAVAGAGITVAVVVIVVLLVLVKRRPGTASAPPPPQQYPPVPPNQ